MGAGPGDPRLITLRGKEVLESADVVLYDALANSRLLQYAPAHAECTLVGHRHGRATISQAEIERLIVEHARSGKTVVRLKGGDPFIFGRGGEEAEACAAAGLDFEVVPGVTSAVAVPAYAGIALTHREHSSMVTVITGRPGEFKEEIAPDWEMLARAGGTLVFLMAMTRIADIAAKLVAAGMSPDTPAAAIRWGTLPKQRSVVAGLGDIAERAERALVRPPVVFVIGAVASLAERLAWYERLPLFGRKIVVTRARHQAGELSSVLERAGAWVVEFPTIEIRNIEIPPQALARAGEYDWLVLTSVNGVETFFSSYLAAGHDLRELAGVDIAAIGPATAAAVERRGLKVAALPAEYRAESLLEALGEVAGKRVMLARAEVAREVLPDELRSRGALVEIVPVYRTVIPDGNGSFEALGEVDMVTFTSSSTVSNFDRMNGGDGARLLAGTAVAAIGPITAATLEKLGVQTDVMPDAYTIPDLVAAIEAFFAKRPTLN